MDTEISSETSQITWDEITESVVDEEALWKNVDQDILEYVAAELQTLVAKYEYICASAFYEISGYDFTKENGELTWSTSKEFIEVFNEQILSERK